MQSRFISIPRFMLLVVLLAGLFGQPQSVKALTGITLTAVTPYVTLDSNDSCNAGPRAEYIQIRVTNTTGGTLNNLAATINFPASTPGGSYTGTWQLDAEELTTRYIGSLAAGASTSLYYFVNYPCESVGGQPAPIVKNYSLTVSNGTAPDVTQNLTLTTRFEISANAGGQLFSFDIAPGAVLGQIIKMTTVYDYGNVGSGNDLGLQPAGNVSFNSGCYQLVASDITDVSGITGITTADDNLLYKTGVSSGGGTNRITVDYYFQVVCVSATATSLSPWADMVSGTQQKYTGNYTEPPTCATTPCDTSAPAPTNPFTITKSASPTNLPAGGTATYTVSVNNTSAYDAVIDRIVDVLPPGVIYGALVNGAACPGTNEVTAANSSSLPAAGATDELHFIATPLNTTAFPPSGGYAVPSNGSISLCYTVTIPNTPGTYTNSATAQSGNVSTGPATSTVTVGTPSFTINKDGTLDTTVVAPSGRADAGDVIHYSIVLTNTGTLPLTGVTVSDPLLSNLDCDGTAGAPYVTSGITIPVGGSRTCTGSYTLTQADLDTNGGGDGDIDNTATADTNETGPQNSSQAVPFTQAPALNVAKNTNTNSVTAAGQIVPYTFAVTNTGNMTLTGITVTDPMCSSAPARQSGDTNNDNQLQITEIWVYTCNHTVTQAEVDAGGSLSNTVTADSNESAPDTDTLDIPVTQNPGINIAKTPATQSVVSGGTASFTLTVTNTGNVTLTGISVTDARCTTGPTLTGGDTNSDTKLQTTETWTYSCSVANVTAAFTNTASVTTTQGVTDSDTADVTLAPVPAMNVVKSSTTTSITSAGQVVPYTFTVTNTGNVTLTGVTVIDPLCNAAPAYQSGDTNNDTQLQTTESWIYTCSHTVTQTEIDAGGSLNNTVTVDSTESGPDTDTHNIPITQTAGINVVKNSTTASVTTVGQSVPYTFTVTNTGNVTLTGVTVTDAMCDAAPAFQSGDTNNDTQLQTTETWIFTCAHTVTQAEINSGGSLINTVTVTSDQSGPDTDTHSIPVVQGPALNVAKSSTTTSITSTGQVVPYTFTVTNTGNVTLTGITVVDPMCGTAPAYQSGDTNNDSQLQTTETWVYTCSHTVTQAEIDAGGNLSNTVTVDSDQTGPKTDTHTIPVTQSPGITVAKSSTTTSITSVGQVVPYVFTLTNSGNVTLTSVTVTDPMCNAAPVRQSGDTNNDNQLQTTETWIYTCSHTVTQAEIDKGGNLSNTVTADSSQTGPDTDTLDIPVSQSPGINIAKTPATQSVVSGGTASFTLTVTNTGNITLTGVTVTDSQCTTGPTRTGGDTNNDNQLQISETWTYSCSVANVAEDFTNTADVTTSEEVTDSDSASVTVVSSPAPALNIVKEVSREANGPWNDTSISVTVGDTVYYRIRVSNTGNITLNGLTVNDGMPGCTLDREADITGNDDAFFEVGEEWAYTCSIPAVLGTNNNTATADTNETSPSSDTASYTATAAQVADPAISKSGDPTKASVGESVTFTLTVTNQGSIPATDVVITDPLPAIFDVTAVTVTGAPSGTVVDVTPAIGTGPAPYTVVVTLGGDLGVEDIVTIRIVTTVNGQGNPPINNTASLTTSASTDVVTNNADAVTITINSPGNRTRKNVLPATGYARDTRTILPDQPSILAYASTDVVLEIPALGLKMPVVGVPKKNGAWNVSWLGNQAGWLEGSAFPSWNGNSVLTGHVYQASGLPGPFVSLNKLKYGDRLIIHAYGQKYIFAVQANTVVDATDSTVMKHEEKSWLTLLTCRDYDEKTGSYRNRVVVRAVLVRVEQE